MSLPGVLQVPERKSLSLIYPFFLSTPGSSPNKTKTQPFVVFRELKATSQSPDQTDAQLANYKGLELHLIRRRALEKRRNLVLGSVWVDTDFWTCSSLFQDKIAGNCLDISPEDVGLSPLNPLSMAISWGTSFSGRHTYHIKWFNSVRLISPLFLRNIPNKFFLFLNPRKRQTHIYIYISSCWLYMLYIPLISHETSIFKDSHPNKS